MHGITNLKLYTRRIVASPGSQLDFSAPNWNQVYKARVQTEKDGEDGKHGLDGPKGEWVKSLNCLKICYCVGGISAPDSERTLIVQEKIKLKQIKSEIIYELPIICLFFLEWLDKKVVVAVPRRSVFLSPYCHPQSSKET